jgi:uncharacterized repeat protein (TIGR01451 family)
MKTIRLKFITGAMFILILIGTANQGYSQFLGLYTNLLGSDSVVVGTVCQNDSIHGYILWYNAGTYLPGDYVDFNIDWGDGNTTSYPGVPIIPGSGYGSINSFNIGWIYPINGSYTVIVTSDDNYGNHDADTFDFDVSNLCGTIYTAVYVDNGDGVYGAGDFPMGGVDLNLTSGGPSYFSTTNFGSSYISNVDISQPSYTLEIDPSWLASSGMSIIDPISTNYTVAGLPGSQSFQFLLDCGSVTYFDASVCGYAWGFLAGTHEGYADFWIHNTSCNGVPVNMDISLDFDPMLTVYYSSLPGGTISSGNISWTGISIPNGYTVIKVWFTVPPGTPPLTPLAFLAGATSTSAIDGYSYNNTYAFNSEVRNSWDPNDKSTNVEHYIDVNTQEDIFYTVRFQNMGNANASNIHIVDSISSLLDLATFKVVAQSHTGSYSIDPATREVIFNFPNINLVPQSSSEELSQGYVIYSIKENPGLDLNSDIKNTAYIFFDGNAPVVTNTTSNVNIANVGIQDESPLSSVTVYPVPANTFVQISGITPQDITGLKILDMSGKVVQIINQNISGSVIQVSEIPNGFYFLEITSGMNSIVKKICVQH